MIGFPAFAAPDSTPDSNASVVFLRSSCAVAGATMENCFESMTALTNVTNGWIWTTRQPSATSRLIVDVGPGEFGQFACDGDGFVTVRGAGRENTILRAGGSTGIAALVQNCVDLSFIDIGFSGGEVGVKWIGGGNASWVDVDFVTTSEAGISYGWYDQCDSNVEAKSVHYIHSSRARNVGTGAGYTSAYGSSCAETWYFGGEVLTTIDANTAIAAFGVNLADGAVFQAFGTAIRVSVVTDDDSSLTLFGVQVTSNNPAAAPYIGHHKVHGMFHSHGGVISVKVAPAASQSVNATGISASVYAMVHTPGTAFVIEGGTSGQSKRLVNTDGTANVMDAFLWQAGPKPPMSTTESNRVSSISGLDLWVETDCSTSGACNSSGTETHLMIYNSAKCGSTNPWFDTQMGACRQ